MSLFGRSPSMPIPGSPERPPQKLPEKPAAKPVEKPNLAPKPFIDSRGLRDWEFKSQLKKELEKFGTSGWRYKKDYSKPVYGSGVGKVDDFFKKYGAGKGGAYSPGNFNSALSRMEKERRYTKDSAKKIQLEKHIALGKQLQKRFGK